MGDPWLSPTAQTAQVKDAWEPKTRAILALMRLNFLSADHRDLTAVGSHRVIRRLPPPRYRQTL